MWIYIINKDILLFYITFLLGVYGPQCRNGHHDKKWRTDEQRQWIVVSGVASLLTSLPSLRSGGGDWLSCVLFCLLQRWCHERIKTGVHIYSCVLWIFTTTAPSVTHEMDEMDECMRNWMGRSGLPHHPLSVSEKLGFRVSSTVVLHFSPWQHMGSEGSAWSKTMLMSIVIWYSIHVLWQLHNIEYGFQDSEFTRDPWMENWSYRRESFKVLSVFGS